MAQRKSSDQIHWSYFINPDKSAAPVFDQLCRGLAQVIRRLEPANNPDLTPSRLANFYRTCGADFDELFKNTGDNGISFLYRTLGCYHSLQPTRNAFEAPSVPCLTEDGFVRWQTLQLLLCPDEHINVLQKAVQVYDVPRLRTDSEIFPRSIPRECFPSRPDAEMEKWHRFVTSQMNQESYMHRLKFSPYVSPQPESARKDGYFDKRTPSNSRPNSEKRKTSNEEEAAARRDAARRRSSVPDILSPGGTNYHQKVDDRAEDKNLRSQSVNRPVNRNERDRNRPRSNSGAPQSYQYPAPPYQRQQNNSQSRYNSNNLLERPPARPPRPQRDRDHSSASRPSTEDDVSSDDSYPRRKPRSSDEDRPRRSRWGSSLMPSFFLSSNKRRHSSDGRVPTLQNDDDRSPNRRKDSIRKYATEGPSPRNSNASLTKRDERSTSGVRFKPNPFNPADASRSPVPPDDNGYKPGVPPSSYRYSEPYPTYQPPMNFPNPVPSMNKNGQPPGSNPYYPSPPSGNPGPSRVDQLNNFEARKQGLPVRVATVGNPAGRRRFPPDGSIPETRSGIEPVSNRQRTASMRNMGVSSMV